MSEFIGCSRRAVLRGAGTVVALLPLAGARATAFIRQRRSSRVIVDNDFAGDPDGLVALAHQLLNGRTRVTLVTSSALDPTLSAGLPAGKTAAAGAEAALQLMKIAGLEQRPPIAIGAERFGAAVSPAARAIVAEAMRDDPLPLILTCGGPLTNVAAALRLEPRIALRLTLIWIGGDAYPGGGSEYNIATDIDAARHVFERSPVTIWQVTQPAYRQMQYSVAEMNADFRSISPLTAWLYARYTALPAWVDLGGSLIFGDSPLVLLSGLSAESSRFREIAARRILPGGGYGDEMPNRRIRLFEDLDSRLVLADMLAAFRLKAHS